MTDTTNDSVLPAPAECLEPARRWWALVLAGVGLLLLAGISIGSLIPATVVAERYNERVGEYQATPYAQIPASAESVNDRVVFGELPDGVERFEPDGDFFFVTVSAPRQSLLSWFAGRDDPAVEFLTFEDKYGFRTPTQRREINLQAMELLDDGELVELGSGTHWVVQEEPERIAKLLIGFFGGTEGTP